MAGDRRDAAPTDRRAVLGAAGAVGLAALAGCTGGAPADPPPNATRGDDPTATDANTPTAAPTDTSAGAPSPADEPPPDVTAVRMFQYVARNSGHGPGAVGPKSDVSHQWAVETGAGASSSPAVVHGTGYVGSSDGGVYALEAATGAERWVSATNSEVGVSPAVAVGTVSVGSADHAVSALSG